MTLTAFLSPVSPSVSMSEGGLGDPQHKTYCQFLKEINILILERSPSIFTGIWLADTVISPPSPLSYFTLCGMAEFSSRRDGRRELSGRRDGASS